MICRDLDSTLVFFSTDYVFGLDEQRRSPLSETDPPGPVSVYGLSKLAGEYLVRSICPKHFVIRTCGLYGVWGSGGKGGNFVETMLKIAGEGKPAASRKRPALHAELHRATSRQRPRRLFELASLAVYHVTNAGDCTWYEFAGEIFRVAGLAVDLVPITSAEFGSAARRPAYSVLANDKLKAAGIDPPRHWHRSRTNLSC